MRYFLVMGLFLPFLSGQVLGEETSEDPKLYSMRINNGKFDMTYKEIERGDNFSVAKVKFTKGGGSPLGSAMCILKGATDVAKMRGFDYVFQAKQSREPNDSFVFKFYYLNDNTTDLKTLLGKDYSSEALNMYNSTGYLSVEEYGKVIDQALSGG